MHNLFLESLTAWRPLGYLLIFIGMMIEGDIFLFTAAFLTHQGFFSPMPVIVLGYSGSFIGDMIWYYYGQTIVHIIPFIGKSVNKIVGPFDRQLSLNPFRTIFTTKFTYGVHHPILMRARIAGIPPKKFIESDLLAIALWMLLIGSLGYFFSAYFRTIRHMLRLTEVSILAVFFGFFIIEYVIKKISKRNLHVE
ncbi:VTT domain-containing protein [Candidatus Parcubacteria bacterium]|nr:VTT domain-containing protein [Candidatus Parcubacteria bacterium]